MATSKSMAEALPPFGRCHRPLELDRWNFRLHIRHCHRPWVGLSRGARAGSYTRPRSTVRSCRSGVRGGAGGEVIGFNRGGGGKHPMRTLSATPATTAEYPTGRNDVPTSAASNARARALIRRRRKFIVRATNLVLESGELLLAALGSKSPRPALLRRTHVHSAQW